MKELQEIRQVVRHLQQIAALATVISVDGSAYRKPGARMLITQEGQTSGMISGGCLENDVIEHAKQVMLSGQSRVVTYDTTTDEDLLWGFGLGCQGIIQILIEPLEPQNDYFPLNLLANRQFTILATVVQVEGSVKVKIGDRLILQSQEVVVNDIEETALSHSIFLAAQRVEHSRMYRYSCPSGSVEVFLEVIQPPLSLVVFGAGGDAVPLVQFAKMLGWMVTIVDCRANEASEQRFSLADSVILTRRDQLQQQVKIDLDTVALVMTHNYFDDLAILQWLLPSSIRYLGLLGSQKRSEQLLKDLQLTSEQLQKLYTPVGLDIGSNTPEEIALAIIAEIQAVLNKRSGGFFKKSLAGYYMSTIGLIILAAGASTRMGTPKQLLSYGGISLLRHTVNVALHSVCHPIIVVLGAYFDRIKPEVEHLPIYLVQNTDWENGMGTSIRAGVKALERISPKAMGVVITVCDQPFLSVDTITQLVDADHLTDLPIIASEYAGTVGVPALFDIVLFEELMALKGTEGAKQVIERYKQEIFRVNWPEGAIDLDTPEDYKRISNLDVT